MNALTEPRLTPEQLTTVRCALARAAKHTGSMAALAETLGVSRQILYYWREHGSIPPTRAVQIEEMTDGRVKRETLRPDLYE